MDREKYGIIEGVTDKDYYTNSNHIPVSFNIGAVEKTIKEGLFHEYLTAGNITYVEIDGGDVKTRAKFIRKHLKAIMKKSKADYVAYNFSIRTCKNDGVRLENKEKICSCGSTDIQGISRVTGYMSLDERFGPGKLSEREDRVRHN